MIKSAFNLEMVNASQNEQLKSSIYQVKKPKERKKSEVEILYVPCEYQIKTDIQTENQLLDLEKERKKINEIAKEPKKEAKGFFSQKIITFVISCEELNSNVKRNIKFSKFFFSLSSLFSNSSIELKHIFIF